MNLNIQITRIYVCQEAYTFIIKDLEKFLKYIFLSQYSCFQLVLTF
jgi:hypothetical protein